MGHREAQQVLDSDHCTGKLQRFALYRVAEIVNPHSNWEYWQKPAPLADELGVAEGSVRKWMADFVAAGWLIVIEQGGGRGNPTRYRWVGPPSDTASPIAVSDPETAAGVTETDADTASPIAVSTDQTALPIAVSDRETAMGVPETATGVAKPPIAPITREEREEVHVHPAAPTAPDRAAAAPSFAEFWKAYPVKRGKIPAERTWKRMTPLNRRLALERLPAYVASVKNPEYLQHGSTYVSRQTWLDFDAPTSGRGQVDELEQARRWNEQQAARRAAADAEARRRGVNH